MGTLHFVANPERRCSVARTLTIEGYRREQQERLGRREAVPGGEAEPAEVIPAGMAEQDGRS